MNKLIIDDGIEELEHQVKQARQRLWKLKRYYQYFRLKDRYLISFREFVRKVVNGTWDPYLA